MGQTRVFSLILVLIIFGTFITGVNVTHVLGCEENSHEDCSLKTSCYQQENFAEWRASNDQSYLYIRADNYYNLGLLEGKYLAFQIAWFKLIIILQAQQLGLPYEFAYQYATEYLEFIPEHYIIEMQGMADAIETVPISLHGVDYEVSIDFLDILVQNTFWDFYYGKMLPILSGFPQPPLIAGLCTAVGSFTSRTPMLAQNMDLTFMMVPTTAWVFTNLGNKHIFTFRMGAMLALGGINKRGIAISVNLVEVLNVGSNGVPLSIRYRTALETAKTAYAAKNIITSSDNTLGWNYIIRDNRRIYTVETIPNANDIKLLRRGKFTFDANVYENVLFKSFMLYPSKYLQRYDKVSELCQILSQDNNLDKKDLFSIISYYDGTNANILRPFETYDAWEVGTAGSFMIDSQNNIYFWNLSPNLDYGYIRL